MEQGLAFPGVGLHACPVAGSPIERLMTVPLGGDRMNVCEAIKSQGGALSRVRNMAPAGGLPGLSSPGTDQLSTLEVRGGPGLRASHHDHSLQLPVAEYKQVRL